MTSELQVSEGPKAMQRAKIRVIKKQNEEIDFK